MAVTQDDRLTRRGGTDPALYDSRADSDDIRRDIDQTRSEMDRTIDEFAERLRPRNLFDDMMCAVRDSVFGTNDQPARFQSRQMTEQLSSAAGQAGRSLVDAVRENPVPAALMGAGLAWLLFEDKAERSYRRMRHDYNQRGYRDDRWHDPGTHSGSFVDARTGKPYAESYGAGYEDVDFDGEPDVCPPSLKDKAADAASSVKHAAGAVGESLSSAASKASQLAGKTAHAVKGASDKTRHAASAAGRSARSAGRSVGEYGRSAGSSMRHAGSAMGEYGHSAAESMRHYGHVVSDGVSHGVDASRERFDRALEEKPLVVGLAAMAAGLLAGFALPHTKAEDRMCGRTSDRLKDEARRRGQEALDEGKEVAMHVADTALGDAEGQGLTPGSLGDKVARVAKDVVHAAKESAEREGIDPHSLGEKAKHVGHAVKEKGKEELEQKKSKMTGEAERSSDKKPFEDKSSILIAESSGIAGDLGTTSGGAASLSAGGMTDTIGGLSDDMPSTAEEGEIKHEIAEGMSEASETKKKEGLSGGGCECC